jgi:MFS family permease
VRLALPAPLRYRDFRLLFVGQAVSLLGDGMLGVALAFAILDLTGSASDLGFVLAARSVPMVVFLLAGGVFADRWSRRAVMLVADAIRFFALGAVAVLLLTGTARIWELAVAMALTGAASAFFYPASTGFVPMTVPPELLQQANGLRAIAMAAGNIGGPVVSGALVATVGSGSAIAVDAGTFLVSVVSLAGLRVARNAPLEVRPFLHDLREGWDEFRSRTWVWTFVGAAGINNMVNAAWPVLGPAIAKAELGGAGAWAAIVAAGGAGSVVGGVATLRLRPARPLVLSAALLAFLGLQCFTLAIVAPVPVIAAASFLGGLAVMTSNTLFETALQRHVPPAALSRVSAYDWFGSLTFNPIGFAVVGPVAVAIGRTQTLLVPSIWFLVVAAGLCALPSVRGLR